MDENRRLVQEAFDAWQAGTALITDILADDLTWDVEGQALAAGTYRSKAAFVEQVLAPFAARFAHGERFRPVSVKSIHADGDTVIVVWDGAGVANDGQPYENRYVWILRLRDGMVTDAAAFFDTIAFNELWARVEPAS